MYVCIHVNLHVMYIPVHVCMLYSSGLYFHLASLSSCSLLNMQPLGHSCVCPRPTSPHAPKPQSVTLSPRRVDGGHAANSLSERELSNGRAGTLESARVGVLLCGHRAAASKLGVANRRHEACGIVPFPGLGRGVLWGSMPCCSFVVPAS